MCFSTTLITNNTDTFVFKIIKLSNILTLSGTNLSVAINTNQVVAVLKTRTNAGRQGYADLFGLPVGTYQIVELAQQADGFNYQGLVGTTNVPTNGLLANNSYLRQANTPLQIWRGVQPKIYHILRGYQK